MAVTPDASVTFWYGCNMTRHGEIVRLVTHILDAVGVAAAPPAAPATAAARRRRRTRASPPAWRRGLWRNSIRPAATPWSPGARPAT